MEFLRAEKEDAAETFTDKKQVWIVDKDQGFIKASIVKDVGDSLTVAKAMSNEVCENTVLCCDAVVVLFSAPL